MKILFSLVLLALISCGGKSGGGSGASLNVSTVPYPYTAGTGYETIEKFRDAVENNKWAQNYFFRNFNTFTFNYRKPYVNDKCTDFGGVFRVCIDKVNDLKETPILTTKEQKGSITSPLIKIERIKDIVKRAVFAPGPDPTIPYASRSYYGYQFPDGHQYLWTIILGKETLVFYLGLPLGANPIYYKDALNNEYSLKNFDFLFVP